MSNTQGGALSYEAQYGTSYEPQPYATGHDGAAAYGAGPGPYEGSGPSSSYGGYDTGHQGAPGAYETYGSGGYGTAVQDPYATYPQSQDTQGAYEPYTTEYAADPGPAPDPYDLIPAPSPAADEPLLPRQHPVSAALQAARPDDPDGPDGDGRTGDGRRAARRRKGGTGAGPGTEKPDTFRKLVPQALVVAFLAGGTSAFVANDKAIELSVDGAPRTLHTFADDVTELLEKEGVHIGEHDLVAPGPGQTLASGDEVVVRYGRPVVLTLDGERRQVWTTAQTVDGALKQFGVRAEGAYLSASRSAAIGRRGLTLDVRTERTLTVMADGREHTIRTNAATVEEAVGEAGISLGAEDTTSVPMDSFPRDGQTVTVMRITGSKEIREEAIDFKVVRKNDASIFQGTEEVERAGVKGSRKITYVLRTVNGVKQKPKKFSEEISREPVDQVVRVGTKPMPTSVAGADGLNWEGLAQCESGGRANITDSTGTYGGLYQFDRQTWQSLGGSGAAHEATAEEQTFRAKKLYVQRGASPWPHCGRKL
ncbi:ubiquitin-like domain-containing protein [Streptomyces sp. NPDC087440]|uniref:ubiquitin-like domain-containing protein n=1 Tax=Streptomyces sp. NPDC087440 TaxID=3365790 RepID=UPI00382A5F84